VICHQNQTATISRTTVMKATRPPIIRNPRSVERRRIDKTEKGEFSPNLASNLPQSNHIQVDRAHSLGSPSLKNLSTSAQHKKRHLVNQVKLSVTCVIWSNSSHEFFLPQSHLLLQLRRATPASLEFGLGFRG
jgi:hypothetical protein